MALDTVLPPTELISNIYSAYEAGFTAGQEDKGKHEIGDPERAVCPYDPKASRAIKWIEGYLDGFQGKPKRYIEVTAKRGPYKKKNSSPESESGVG